ncbi:MAG: hypothetical protein LBS83_02800 [Holosporales bacterium]|jgi:hypothetical protein|nr:hypothetical protein [Holosporales bacterium]
MVGRIAAKIGVDLPPTPFLSPECLVDAYFGIPNKVLEITDFVEDTVFEEEEV